MVEVVHMPEPIAAPRPPETRPGIEPLKSSAALKPSYDLTFDRVIPNADQSKIFHTDPKSYEADSRLDAITDPSKKSAAAAVLAEESTEIHKAAEVRGKFEFAVINSKAEKDDMGRYTGKFEITERGKDGKDETIAGNAKDADRGAVRGLKRAIAETEGSVDPKQQELNKQAKEALAGIRSNVRVDTHKDGAEVEITLQEWEQQVDQKAFEMWRTDNPSVAEDAARAEFDKTSPLVRHAYQLRAETAIDAQAEYKFVYAEEKPATTADEAAAQKEPEKPTDKILTTAERIVQELGINIDGMTKEQIEKLEANPALTGLLIDLIGYRHAKPGSQGQQFVLLGLYERLQDPELLELFKANPETQARISAQIEQLKRDPDLHGTPREPGELGKIESSFLTYVIYPALKVKYGDNWEHHARQIGNSHLIRNFSYAVAFSQARGINREMISSTFSSIRAEAVKRGEEFNYTEDDVDMIAALAEKGEGRDRMLDTVRTMGIEDPRQLAHPSVFIENHMEDILTISKGEGELTPEKKDQRRKAFLQYGDIEDVKVREKLLKKLFNPKLLYGLGGIAMIFSMFHNTLNFGLVGEEEGHGGHP